MFLDPNKPFHTCNADKFEGCAASYKVVCYFNVKHLIIFLALAFSLFNCIRYFVLQALYKLCVSL
jgi:hypothetical protein